MIDRSHLYKRHLFIDAFGRIVDRDNFIGVDDSASDLTPVYYLVRTSYIETTARGWDTALDCPTCGKRCTFRHSDNMRWFGHSLHYDTFGYHKAVFCPHVVDFDLPTTDTAGDRVCTWVFCSVGDGAKVRSMLDRIAPF
jgi:hypothetical protein